MLSLNSFFNDPQVLALVSDRSVDFSLNPDKMSGRNGQAAFSPEQKDFLLKHIGPLEQKIWERIVFLKQMHGAEVVCVGKTEVSPSPFPEADALITREEGVPLAVRSADCLPIFLFDPETKAVGLVHAGWRGSLQGIVKNTVQRMMREWKTDPQDLKAAFGPALRDCCYRVGAEFKEYFPEEIHPHRFASSRERRSLSGIKSPKSLCDFRGQSEAVGVNQLSDEFTLDLALVNKNQLLSVGVKADNIFDCGICTSCDSRFFSYRREEEKAGRMISLVMLK